MLPIEPQTLVGTWRRFGNSGPVYEILAPGEKLPTVYKNALKPLIRISISQIENASKHHLLFKLSL
jgi:hypothetical protein